MRRPVLVLITLLILPVQSAHAHVKWLYQPGVSVLPTVPTFQLSDPAVVFAIELIIIALLLARELNRLSETSIPARHLTRVGHRHWPALRQTVALLLGIALLRSALDGVLLAPHLGGSGPAFDALRVIEACSGLLFILGRGFCAAASALFLVWGGVLTLHGPVAALEYVSIPGVAIFLSASCLRHWRWQSVHRLAAMRVLIGLSLTTLAFTEKLLQPQMAMELLAQHPFNFMQAMGINYSDRLFILSAGSTELIFGLCLIFGLATRLTVLALSCLLIASNGYFFFIGDYTSALLEAGGHAPLFAAVLPLLAFGKGQFAKRRGLGGVRWQIDMPRYGRRRDYLRRAQRNDRALETATTLRSSLTTSMRNP